MIYEIGTISTKANDPRITGKSTLWKNSVTKVSVGQIILIQSGNTIYQNSIRSVESDTQMTLSFPVPVALTDVKYVISITMIGSVSDGVNKATAMVTESYQLMMIMNRLMTESGVIKVVLPDGTEMQLRTEKERDRLLDDKFDKKGGTVTGPTTFNHTNIKVNGTNDWTSLRLVKQDGSYAIIQTNPVSDAAMISITNRDKDEKTLGLVSIPNRSGTAMLVGDYGWGGNGATVNYDEDGLLAYIKSRSGVSRVFRNDTQNTTYSSRYSAVGLFKSDDTFTALSAPYDGKPITIIGGNHVNTFVHTLYTNRNTTKDSNGNLKAASPIVKLFSDDVELNEESEGVEMEHLGVGHYLIKGVVGFNADGAWGINNGFVIPQDHNGKNMVLIDYEVRPDGDIEVFVFHQQNADMPERFQNKRIKHFDEEGVPVYFENYEPCDVPESRWIDMRVEMPPNSTYNQKQAEAERLAKLDAERLEQEEAKRAAEEVERTEQEAAERKQYGLDENSVLL
ncbi:phage tail fiber protein [Providencia sp. PROV038]|uniref:phage tail fiber protein n=1 Tax=Providencia sp. PROV038 TaxID=2949769 RepID=UPI00234AD868|nr:hypothetical protein [Providencia sp. PROV038]